MKKFALVFAVLFMCGLLFQSYDVKAQEVSASDKDYEMEFVMSHIYGWVSLIDWTSVRHFTTKSGKEQYKMEGWWGWFKYEIVVNVNATGENGMTEGVNCVADGTVYNMWGWPIICGHNQQLGGTGDVFGYWGPWLIIDMDWGPCFYE